jgi:phosphoribosylformimino-5-aminoimidazole carboxamide ribotide isomerase
LYKQVRGKAMILVIPTIEIKAGKCACLIQGLPEKVYPDDPVEMAKIWRSENAKILHLIDGEGKLTGSPENWEMIEKISNAVDIPVQVSGGFRNYENVKRALELGALRVVLDSVAIKDKYLLKDLIKEFSPKRITFIIEAKNCVSKTENAPAVEIASELKEIGFERVVYKDVFDDETINYDALKEFSMKSDLKITAFGELNGYPDLNRLIELEKFGLDSVILNRTLYQNRFPCQHLWRIVEAEIP